jgi:hypothetical protein
LLEDSGDEDVGDPYDEALVLCGVEFQHSLQAIAAQGFDNLRDWLTLSKEAIVEFVKALNKLKVTVSKKSYAVSIPFGSTKKLQAMRNWAKERHHCEQTINEAAFNVSELHHILDRMDFKAQLKVKKQEA